MIQWRPFLTIQKINTAFQKVLKDVSLKSLKGTMQKSAIISTNIALFGKRNIPEET